MERETIPLSARARRIGGLAPPGRATPRPRPVLDAERRLALRDAWAALWRTRLLVWATGLAGLLALGRAPNWRDFDPGALTAPFGAFGDALIAPAARWDAVWYLAIANDGYPQSDPLRPAFFPLYPLLMRAVAPVVGSAVVGGVLISVGALMVALYLLARLIALDFGRQIAALSVALVATFPAAYSFSAIYSESLFLALSAGSIYAARLGRWPAAGAIGALAAATRSAGLVLLVPLVLMYLYGPRADAEPGQAGRGGPSRWRPRHSPHRDVLWLALVPSGLVAFMTYLSGTGADPLAPYQAQEHWLRSFAGPFGAVPAAAGAAWDGARDLLWGSPAPVHVVQGAVGPFELAAQNVVLFGFLVLAVVATVGALRRLPVAYGAYVVAALALPLSYPVGPEPLMSLPRFMAVLFPLHLWLALYAHERRAGRLAVGACALLLALFSAQFTAWRWVT